MSNLVPMDKAALAAEAAAHEAAIAHHKREVQIYAAETYAKRIHEFMDELEMLQDPDLKLKALTLLHRVAGFEEKKQEDGKTLRPIEITINLGDDTTPAQPIILSAHMPEVEDVEYKLPFSAIDVDNL